jgi:hypothetical protein
MARCNVRVWPIASSHDGSVPVHDVSIKRTEMGKGKKRQGKNAKMMRRCVVRRAVKDKLKLSADVG